MSPAEAQKLHDLRTRNHDPLCPRWDLGACFCDLIRGAQARERDRLRRAVQDCRDRATSDEQQAAFQTVLALIGDGSE